MYVNIDKDTAKFILARLEEKLVEDCRNDSRAYLDEMANAIFELNNAIGEKDG